MIISYILQQKTKNMKIVKKNVKFANYVNQWYN